LLCTVANIIYEQTQTKESETYFRISQILLHAGAYDAAIDAFSKAIQIKLEYMGGI